MHLSCVYLYALNYIYDRELEVNGGSNTDRTLAPVRPDAGRRVRSVYLTEENKSGVTGRPKVNVTGR